MTDGADARDTLNSIYATGLRNAHAMEAQAKELLKRQIERLDDYPELKSRLQQHLSETDRQQDRLERILGSLGKSTSSIKDAALALFGNMAAAAHMPARDEVLKDRLPAPRSKTTRSPPTHRLSILLSSPARPTPFRCFASRARKSRLWRIFWLAAFTT